MSAEHGAGRDGWCHVCKAVPCPLLPVAPAESQTDLHDLAGLKREHEAWDNRDAPVHRTDDAERITALEKRVSDAEWEIRELLGQIEKLEAVRQEAGCAVQWCPDCHGDGVMEGDPCVNCGALRDALRDAEG